MLQIQEPKVCSLSSFRPSCKSTVVFVFVPVTCKLSECGLLAFNSQPNCTLYRSMGLALKPAGWI